MTSAEAVAAPDIVAAPPPATEPPARRLRKLALLWGFVRRYPVHLTAALVALVIAALGQIAVLQGFKLVVDHGFGKGASAASVAPYFMQLLAIVAVLGVATAVRFYFVSWIGERVVADLRIAVQAHL